ncbi:partner of xrn-2 protein 1-like [Zophobas morio]|uniref:partner of xrn-2 protein 1-like n=1 Tax=Zophobas morio TaxID=2755281 RepID=UPI003082DAC2
MTQTYPTDWDIEKYRDDTDLEEHWQLRKEFMKTHKGNFPEDYLVALATAFTNIEFMGCSYPAAVMARVAELSTDVAKKYREVKKTKLQRTFVSASNAAENKVKKRQSDPGTYTSNKRARQ